VSFTKTLVDALILRENKGIKNGVQDAALFDHGFILRFVSKKQFSPLDRPTNCYLALTFSFIADPMQIGALVVSARGEMDQPVMNTLITARSFGHRSALARTGSEIHPTPVV
jgi:hypothetical protein